MPRTLTPKQIKAQMILKGIKQADIATQANKSSSAVSQVVNKKMQSRWIAGFIAKALGVTIEEIL
jgi:lambda repressor-like predicted transcriptional regulator